MPEVRIDVLEESAKSLEVLSEHLARVQKQLRYLLGGNIDADNIIANSITANKMDVQQLSAITADLGTITAGLINSVEIYGSLIATSVSSYPRAEMSSSSKLFKVALSPTNYAEFSPDYSTGSTLTPILRFVNGSYNLLVGVGAGWGGLPSISTNNALVLGGVQGVFTISLDVNDWSFLTKADKTRSMQQELNDIWAAIAALQP